MNVADPLLAGCSHSLPYKRTSRERPSFRGSQIVMSAKRIVLQKSKMERCRKSRESRSLDTSTLQDSVAPMWRSVVSLCETMRPPSHRHIRNASAVLENFVHHPKKTFAT